MEDLLNQPAFLPFREPLVHRLPWPAPPREVCLLTLQNRPLSIAARKLYELLEAKAY